MTVSYTGYLGGFDYEHKNPPAPFNPGADPQSVRRGDRATATLQKDPAYTSWTREERKARRDALISVYEAEDYGGNASGERL
ncbi:hypothetical protein [Sphingomonas sp. 3-13AW]|uniref:hypothetical protein n=1 Tax=Sphingomonas sp. 3-13AW TaxID=3050450 RepID=UPI003BB71311